MATVPTIPFQLNIEQPTTTPVVKVTVPATLAAGQQIIVKLVVVDDLGNPSQAATQTLTVRPAPVAVFSAPTVAAAGQIVTFDASKSIPPANLKQFQWTITVGAVIPLPGPVVLPGPVIQPGPVIPPVAVVQPAPTPIADVLNETSTPTDTAASSTGTGKPKPKPA